MPGEGVEEDEIPFVEVSDDVDVVVELVVPDEIDLFGDAGDGFEGDHVVGDVEGEDVVGSCVSLLVGYSVVETGELG